MTTISGDIKPIDRTPDNGIRLTTDVEVFTETADTTERPQAPTNSGRPGMGIASTEDSRNASHSGKSS